MSTWQHQRERLADGNAPVDDMAMEIMWAKGGHEYWNIIFKVFQFNINKIKEDLIECVFY